MHAFVTWIAMISHVWSTHRHRRFHAPNHARTIAQTTRSHGPKKRILTNFMGETDKNVVSCSRKILGSSYAIDGLARYPSRDRTVHGIKRICLGFIHIPLLFSMLAFVAQSSGFLNTHG